MGVDASIFARKAKKYYYFDRLYNVIVFDVADDDDVYDRAIHMLRNKKSCTYEDIVYLINKNIEFWKTQSEEDSHRIDWNENVLKFVQMYPGDTFFVATDHEDLPYYEIAKDEGYERYLFPEEI